VIIYSVTVSVDEDVAADWLAYMRDEHIPDVLETGYFEAYRMHRLLLPEPEDRSITYNIQYDCLTRQHYELYREKEAPRLQQAHQERYAGRFVAFRTLLERIDS
jgi:hypothetical protein